MRRYSGILMGLVASGSAFGVELDRQPYLQSLNSESVTLVWRGIETHSSTVYVRNLADTWSDSFSSDPALQHQVLIDGLEAGQSYVYRVESGGDTIALEDETQFTTAPPVGSTEPFRIWVLGDSGTGGGAQMAVRDAMLQSVGGTTPDFMIHVGDMAYGDGTDFEFTLKFFAPYAEILRSIPVWPAIGNHEGRSSDSASQTGPYYDGYVLPTGAEAGGLPSGTEAYYSFDFANVHFVSLDSHQSSREPGDAMLTWLEADLASTEQDWIVAFWHHPPYTKGTHDSDIEYRHIEMRENALPILEAAGVDLVLGGHSHIYERSYLLDGGYDTPSTENGILDAGNGQAGSDGSYLKEPGLAANDGAIYIVSGHGGTSVGGPGGHPLMQFYEVENGSVLLDFHDNRLGIQNVRIDGLVTDRATLIKGDAIQVVWPNGGESLEPGLLEKIRWETQGNVALVDIEVSCDSGTTWEALSLGLENTGEVDWEVPELFSSEMMVRVSASDGGGLSDRSDGVFGLSSSTEESIFTMGSEWRYHDQGEDLGSDWTSPDYDDSTWPVGMGELGYGDGDEGTVLYDEDPENFPSVYFRKAFSLDETPDFSKFHVRFDDAVAVWLNGTLIFHQNFGNGSSYGVWASDSSGDNAILIADLEEAPWQTGENVLAVMVKQLDSGSSDLSFDMSLDFRILQNDALPTCPTETEEEDTAEPSGEASEDCGCSSSPEHKPWGWAGLAAIFGWVNRRR